MAHTHDCKSVTAPAATTALSGAVRGGPRLLLRFEGAMILAGCLLAYRWLGQSWWLFAALFLAPDVGMLSYLANPRIGAASYNGTHTVAAPALLAVAGLLAASTVLVAVALIWLAHIGFDRMLGYGLKYPTGFRDTHLGRLGRTG